MAESTTASLEFPSLAVQDVLTEVLRDGAQRMLSQAIEAEVRERGDGTYGYVPIDQDGAGPGAARHKLSFVGNSGIKFGSADPRTEAAIFDVQAMVDMAGGIEAFELHDDPENPGADLGIDQSGEVTMRRDPETLYEGEELSRLLHGVEYDGPYMWMPDYISADPQGDPEMPTSEKYVNTLDSNYGHNSSTMIVGVTGTETSGIFNLAIFVNGLSTYFQPNIVLGTLDTFDVQSHWGSGVIFSNMIVDAL